MANLTPDPNTFSPVYQYEENDDVLGGAGGLANLQGQQLANRSAYNKSEFEKGHRININGEATQTDNTAIAAANIGRVIKLAPASAVAITPNLPADVDWPIGRNLFVRYPKGGAFSPVSSVLCTGSQRISDNENALASSFSISPGQIVEFIKVATNLLIANVYRFNRGVICDRQKDDAIGIGTAVPTSGGNSQIGNALTTAAGYTRDYKLEFTWSFNRISTDPEMYIGFYRDGNLLREYHHVAISVSGQTQTHTVHHMDLGVAPGSIYTMRIRVAGSSNQYQLQAYHFSIDGISN